jgi:ABC-type glycerol-3-phosphate transport system substrate-binding protein
MKNFSIFQMVISGVFIIAIIAAVVMVAMNRGGSSNKIPSITVWGILPEEQMGDFLSTYPNDERPDINYKYVSPENFSKELLKSLTQRKSPDAMLVSSEELLTFWNALVDIPKTSFSERDFRDTFVDGSQILIGNKGAKGIPVMIDPLVSYYNKDYFNRYSILTFPKTWEELADLSTKITQKTEDSRIEKSAVALGQSSNINNFKQIILTLMLQAGTPIVERKVTQQGENIFESVIKQNDSYASDAALGFYVQFSDPNKTAYSWSRSLPEAREMFLAGNLAIYFGLSSEYSLIKKGNPNLNFDVAEVPESNSKNSKKVYSRIYFLGALNSSQNLQAVFSNLEKFANSNAQKNMADTFGLSPARRSLLKGAQENPFTEIFYRSSARAYAFFDPNPNQTRTLFMQAVEGLLSGRYTLSGATDRISSAIDDMIKELDL